MLLNERLVKPCWGRRSSRAARSRSAAPGEAREACCESHGSSLLPLSAEAVDLEEISLEAPLLEKTAGPKSTYLPLGRPRSPQDRPKRLQDRPQRLQDRLKIAPRSPKIRLRSPKTASRSPKTAQEPPKTPSELSWGLLGSLLGPLRAILERPQD